MNRTYLLVILFSVSLTSPLVGQVISFTPLGHLPGTVPPQNNRFGYAFGISGDGSAVAGWSSSAQGSRAYRWTAAGGMVDLGTIPGTSSSRAEHISSDGKVVVGTSGGAFRWTEETGMVYLGNSQGYFSNIGYGTDASGNIVVGRGTHQASGQYEAFRWTAAGGLTRLGVLPGDNGSLAFGISRNGAVTVGVSGNVFYQDREDAVYWNSSGGIVNLGDLPGSIHYSAAYRCSSDGSVIVGWGFSGAHFQEAFRWTAATGMVGLGPLMEVAYDVSGDGSVIVGFRDEGVPVQQAMIWTSQGGTQHLADVLTAGGVDLTGWTLNYAFAVSEDGKSIAGWGINPQGIQEPWLVRFSVVPEPSAWVLIGFCFAASAWYWSRPRVSATLGPVRGGAA
jgi:probable HAF family extracellular repeat protein